MAFLVHSQMARLFEPGRTFIARVGPVLGAVELFPVFDELLMSSKGPVAVLAESFRNVVLL